MKDIFKKLTIFITIVIMLFSVIGFTACDNSSDVYLQARIAEIERQNQELRDLLYSLKNAPSDSLSNEDLLALILILQQQIVDLQEDFKSSNADNAELLERIKELEQQSQELQYKITNNLQARLKELKEQNEILLDQIYQLQKVINDTNTSLLALIETLQKQVTELQNQIERLEQQLLNLILPNITEGDFELTITVDKTTFRQSENIEVTARFVNNSGIRLKVYRLAVGLVDFSIEPYYRDVVTLLPVHDYFEIGEVRYYTQIMGRGIRSSGVHDLRANARFHFFYQQGQRIRIINVRSNIITLNVTCFWCIYMSHLLYCRTCGEGIPLANLTSDDFKLTVSVDRTTIRQGENIEVTAVFEVTTIFT